jgi:hypothetical protein
MAAWYPIHTGPMLGPLNKYAPGVLDPYLIWADATGFVDYPSPTKLRVLIEVGARFGVAKLQEACADCAVIAPAYVGVRATICAATVTPEFFGLLAGVLKDKVRRVDLAEPIIPDRPEPWVAQPAMHNQAPRELSKGKLLLGVIDYGCPFAHVNFRTRQSNGPLSTRVLHLWDQDAASLWLDGTAAAEAPLEFGYGRELSRAQMNAVIQRHAHGPRVDEDACYRDSGNTVMRRSVSHGAPVMDLLAGPLPVEARLLPQEGGPIDLTLDGSAAASADIVFVQLPRRCLQDTSGGWLGAQVLDGVRYILACADPKEKPHVVVNISYGSYVGPHDGSSLIERGFAALVAEAKRNGIKLTLVLPAGNSRLKRCHARALLKPGAPQALSWHVLPDTGTPSFVQLWLSRAQDVTVTVTSPCGALRTLSQRDAAVWSSITVPRGMALFSDRHGVEQFGGMVLVALPRTASADPKYPTASSGVWTIEIRNDAARGKEISVAAYVSRNDVDVGMLRRGRQSFLFDPAYDPKRYLGLDDTDAQASAVQRSGTLNGIATGERVVVVGGWRYRDGKQGKTASEGPTRTNGKNVATAGLDWDGVSEESPALRGMLACANRSGTAVRLLGTSFAAPQAARKLAQ